MSVAATDSKTSYLLDKLQSLSGVIPIGAFLAEHFWSNSYALVSVGKYNDVSRELQQIPWRIIVETCVLFIPILFHGLYGIYIWWTGKSNAIGHPWMANWLYVLQRWTGIIAFVFIGWHLYTERFMGHGVTSYADVQRSLTNPWTLTFYIVGITCASFPSGQRAVEFRLQVGNCGERIRRSARRDGLAQLWRWRLLLSASRLCLRCITGRFRWGDTSNEAAENHYRRRRAGRIDGSDQSGRNRRPR